MQKVVQWLSKALCCCCLSGSLSYAWAEHAHTSTSTSTSTSALQADIRWTKYGVPHIKAQDEQGLGYGIGYAYARDNACLLAREIVTVRGQSARYFGAEGESSAGVNHVTSDIFFTWFNDNDQVSAFWQAQPADIQQRVKGYVAGFNRYLADAETSPADHPLSCKEMPWLAPVDHNDMVRLWRRLLIEGGLGQFTEAVVAASPPSGLVDWLMNLISGQHRDPSQSEQVAHQPWQGDLKFGFGSNAVAVGRERSENGKGLLLANPHFPWHGGLRMYQMHLTIPGKLDVMGAALPGLPLVNIGFNQHVAWTHTVDTSSHFTLFELELDPEDNTRYLVDGESRALTKRLVSIEVQDDDGALSTLNHTLYESQYGPLIELPGFLPWSDKTVFALKDANIDNHRVIQQWYAINQAQSVNDIRDSIQTVQGIPWVNTLATDDQGLALYMNHSVTPNVSSSQRETCLLPRLMEEGLPGLKGNQQACYWVADKDAVQPGITPADQLPVLLREDFVQNANGSAWMTNPDQPLEGFSPLVSKESSPLKLRTRFALSRLAGDTPLTADLLQKMVTDNRVYLADLVLDDLLSFCRKQTDSDMKQGCQHLSGWDRHAGTDSTVGGLYFESIMLNLLDQPEIWQVPFDSSAPLVTPRGLAISDSDVTEAIEDAFSSADEDLAEWNVSADSRWGDIQVARYGDKQVAIPGGLGELGIYNVIEGDFEDQQLTIKSGSSYIQLVSFDEQGPQARGLLTFSQSSDPLSVHYGDQAELFSQQIWPVIPFTDAQIEADPALVRKQLVSP